MTEPSSKGLTVMQQVILAALTGAYDENGGRPVPGREVCLRVASLESSSTYQEIAFGGAVLKSLSRLSELGHAHGETESHDEYEKRGGRGRLRVLYSPIPGARASLLEFLSALQTLLG